MKTKLVLWGKNAQEERVLTAIELNVEENKVGVFVFPEAVATDDFANELMQKWRDGKEMEIPENHEFTEKELSVTESILPEELKLDRPDLLTRAQTEWHFVVLSSKLHDAYRSEVNDFKDKIEKLDKFDSKVWEQLKGFWAKVQEQVKDQNLFRDHANGLRESTNELFNSLKGLRVKMEKEFQERSTESVTTFMSTLEGVEERITEGSRLSAVFDELKGLQRKFKEARFTKEDRSKVWARLDSAFKAVKEKRFGPEANQDNSAMSRLDRRMNGLLQAIDRMEKSIHRDYEDLEFQKRKIARTDGQLESQIRQAKIKMIEERIRSKKERLEDMNKTQTQVDKQIERQKSRDSKREDRERIEAAKKAAEAKIQQDMEAAAAAREDDKLAKAAEVLSGKQPAEATSEVATETTAPSEETLASAVGTVVTETFEDVVDTVKAVASVVTEKAKEAIEEVMQSTEEATETTETVVAQAETAVESNANEELAQTEDVALETSINAATEVANAVVDASKSVTTDEA